MQSQYNFIKMLTWQLLATGLVSVVALFVSGKSAAISAFLGGFSVVFASAFAGLIFVRNKNKKDATAVLVSLLTAEAVKLVFVFICLFLVITQYKNLVPFALIIGLMAAALVSGAAISRQHKID